MVTQEPRLQTCYVLKAAEAAAAYQRFDGPTTEVVGILGYGSPVLSVCLQIYGLHTDLRAACDHLVGGTT